MSIEIRHATIDDLPRIVEIYNESIPGGWSTADTRPVTVADRLEWFRKFDANRRPIWVAEREGQILAWTCLTSFYGGRPAYDATAEISVYVSVTAQRQGLGRMLKKYVLEQCPKLGITSVLSMYFDHNAATRRVNQSLGFVDCGHLAEIAVVDGVKRGLMVAIARIPPAADRTASGAS